MPSDLQMKAMNGIHRIALKATRGRFGWNLLGMQVVELTTTGRKGINSAIRAANLDAFVGTIPEAP